MSNDQLSAKWLKLTLLENKSNSGENGVAKVKEQSSYFVYFDSIYFQATNTEYELRSNSSQGPLQIASVILFDVFKSLCDEYQPQQFCWCKSGSPTLSRNIILSKPYGKCIEAAMMCNGVAAFRLYDIPE